MPIVAGAGAGMVFLVDLVVYAVVVGVSDSAVVVAVVADVAVVGDY